MYSVFPSLLTYPWLIPFYSESPFVQLSFIIHQLPPPGRPTGLDLEMPPIESGDEGVEVETTAQPRATAKTSDGDEYKFKMILGIGQHPINKNTCYVIRWADSLEDVKSADVKFRGRPNQDLSRIPWLGEEEMLRYLHSGEGEDTEPSEGRRTILWQAWVCGFCATQCKSRSRAKVESHMATCPHREAWRALYPDSRDPEPVLLYSEYEQVGQQRVTPKAATIHAQRRQRAGRRGRPNRRRVPQARPRAQTPEPPPTVSSTSEEQDNSMTEANQDPTHNNQRQRHTRDRKSRGRN